MAQKVYQISGSCVRCGYCALNCPTRAIRKNAQNRYEIDMTRCKDCGFCEKNCPQHAVSSR